MPHRAIWPSPPAATPTPGRPDGTEEGATVAVRPETKERLDGLRRRAGLRSMDEAVSRALDQLEDAMTVAEVRRLSRRAPRAERDILGELEEASQGIEETVRAIREGVRKRHARNARP